MIQACDHVPALRLNLMVACAPIIADRGIEDVSAARNTEDWAAPRAGNWWSAGVCLLSDPEV